MEMEFSPQEALKRCIESREIFYDEMISLFRQIMRGEVSPVMVSAITIGLRCKKETVGEIAAAAKVMREFCTKVNIEDKTHLVDVVGTGGDGANTFNISTTTMFVAAAAGAKIAKHGGRAVSSSSGSADLLETLGAYIALTPEQSLECFKRTGICFMFAPQHHYAMKYAAPVRRELGVRTFFNILGPLTNPADSPNIVMGVFHPDLVGIQVRVLQKLGANHAIVVWGKDGLDEISLGASTMIGELKNGRIREYEIHPEDFGIRMSATRNLRVTNVEESKELTMQALENKGGPVSDIVALNAAATLYGAGITSSIEDGLVLARNVMSTGAAKAKLEEFVKTTQEIATV